VRDQHSALDVVQDSMMKLADKYSDRPAAELPLLFQRILQNTIRDYFRRQKVRSTWTSLFSSFQPKDDPEEFDLLDKFEPDPERVRKENPADQLEAEQVRQAIEQALGALPGRQREAFLLRYWEEMDVAETAAVMGCSEGSVKTHCSRANHALAIALRKKGIDL
jgi:RNA polymerase sigma-70 factor (ECF subfamily)